MQSPGPLQMIRVAFFGAAGGLLLGKGRPCRPDGVGGGGGSFQSHTQLKRRPASSCSCHSHGRASVKTFKKKKKKRWERRGERCQVRVHDPLPPPRVASAARTRAEQEKDGKIRRESDLFKIGWCGWECCQTASLSNSDAQLISVATVSLYTPR